MTYQVGIDVGTTYTGAAVAADGRVEVVQLGLRSSVVPTVIFLREDSEVLTGEAANRRALTEPDRVAREFKRRLGDTAPLLLGGTPLSPQALMGEMLEWVLGRVIEARGEPPAHVAVSHPANWGPYKLDLLEQAVRLAHLDAVTTITEPAAAAQYYASTRRLDPGEIVAVYDLGGGTFDAAVLQATELGFEILGTPEGVEHLGGIDIDEAVFGYVARALDGALDRLDPDDPVAIAAAARLRRECVEAKEALSFDHETVIPVLLPGVQSEVRLTRLELEALVRPSLVATIDALERALQSAQVVPGDLAAVLLVGGASRMPLVAELVGEALGRPVAVDTHPKHAVCLGTALAAEVAWSRREGVAQGPVEVVPPRPTPAEPPRGPGPQAVAPAGAAAPLAPPPGATAAPPGADPEAGTAAEQQPAAATLASRPISEGPPSEPPGIVPGAGSGDGSSRGRGRIGALIGGPVVVLLILVGALALRSGDDPGDDTADEPELISAEAWATGFCEAIGDPADDVDDAARALIEADPGPSEQLLDDAAGFAWTFQHALRAGAEAMEAADTPEVADPDGFESLREEYAAAYDDAADAALAIADEIGGLEPTDLGTADELDRLLRDLRGVVSVDFLDEPEVPELAPAFEASSSCPSSLTEGIDELFGELLTASPWRSGPAGSGPVVGASGRGANITGIGLIGDTYVVEYETTSYVPSQGGTPDDHHVHFFFDTTPPEIAGTQVPPEERGVWFVWFEADRFDGWGPADNVDGARQMCALVADYTHAIELGSGNCWALPDA